MNKEDVTRKISKETKIKKKKASKIFDRVIDLMSKDIRKKRLISIESFGEFKIKRQEMKILMSKNNTKVVIPPKDLVEFKLSRNVMFKQNKNG